MQRWYDNVVSNEDKCPHCEEMRMDYLAWQNDEEIKCTSCGHVYCPALPKS